MGVIFQSNPSSSSQDISLSHKCQPRISGTQGLSKVSGMKPAENINVQTYATHRKVVEIFQSVKLQIDLMCFHSKYPETLVLGSFYFQGIKESFRSTVVQIQMSKLVWLCMEK